MSRVVIVDSVRTGLAKAHRGTFNLTRSDDLVAHCIDALLERNGAVDPAEVEDVILGGIDSAVALEQSQNVARHAVALSKQNNVIIVNRRDEFARAKQGNLDLILKCIDDGVLDGRLPVEVCVGRIDDRPAIGGQRRRSVGDVVDRYGEVLPGADSV